LDVASTQPTSEAENTTDDVDVTTGTPSHNNDNAMPMVPRRRIVRRRRTKNPTDDDIILDPQVVETTLKESNLPYMTYSFEITKTVQRIVQLQASHVALQMPEGLLLYASVLADVLKRLVATCCRRHRGITKGTSLTTSSPAPTLEVSILGDVTYGACCVDDLGAQALGCDLLVHYGHSCLVPIQHTVIPCLYVFVEITIDVEHLVECFHLTMTKKKDSIVEQEQVTSQEYKQQSSSSPPPIHQLQQQQVSIPISPESTHVYLLGTIQFRHALSLASTLLQDHYGYSVSIPQAKPLSPGEVLGCTSPVLTGRNDNTRNINSVVLFVSDGRFHLESTLISNPHIPLFYRYDPYSKLLTQETYQHDQMHALRRLAIAQSTKAKVFGIILGTLGRQGNPAILTRIQALLQQHSKTWFVMLASEITPAKLALFKSKVDAWVQIACPRLSVDWGHAFSSTVPLLNPYELFVALGEAEFRTHYPMDYYAIEGGPWSNYHVNNQQRQYISGSDLHQRDNVNATSITK
jgi:2-(3-amino-3-carboxypropyl)histidine synthase